MNEGRITGRKNGGSYELVQRGRVVQIIDHPHDPRFLRAVQRNKWEAP